VLVRFGSRQLGNPAILVEEPLQQRRMCLRQPHKKRDGAIDRGEQEVHGGGKALAAFGRKNGIQQRDEIETLSDIEEGGDVTEGGGIGFGRLRRLAGAFGGGDEGLRPCRGRWCERLWVLPPAR
jgi:hypothetical protein